MSLSEMNKATYKAHSTSIRANGANGIKWIACPLEREDMLTLTKQEGDWLAIRAEWIANPMGDNLASLIRLSSFVGTHSFSNLP